MTNLLAIETATTACSVALCYQGHLYQRHQQIPREHNKILLNMIQAVIDEAGIDFSDLDAIAVGNGPGSFVGARIAVSVAQGIAFAADKPVIPVSTLQTIAQGAHRRDQSQQIWVAIDAHANQVYQQQFQYDSSCQLMLPCSAVSAVAPENLESPVPNSDFCAVGDGWTVYAEKIARPANIKVLAEWLPNAIDLVPIAVNAFAQGDAISAEQAQPIYVRGTSPWQKQRPT